MLPVSNEERVPETLLPLSSSRTSVLDETYTFVTVVIAGHRSDLAEPVELVGTELEFVGSDIHFDPGHSLVRDWSDVVALGPTRRK